MPVQDTLVRKPALLAVAAAAAAAGGINSIARVEFPTLNMIGAAHHVDFVGR